MPKMPNVHIVLDSADGVGTYNDFAVQNPGQNLVQGQIKDVAVSEICFPYDLPNIMPGYNRFNLFNGGGPIQANPPLNITITPGFYTGTELAAAINARIIAQGAANPTGVLLPADLPSVTYSQTNNQFTWVDATNPAYSQDWEIEIIFNPPYDGTTLNYVPASTKNILSIMGYVDPYVQIPGFGYSTQVGDGVPAMGAAPLVFTQFIDIVSNKLARYQHMRDGSSATNYRKTDLVARVYVANDTSTFAADPQGTRPFVIHRQYKNQRVFDWTTDGSVDAIDIRLYDDYGQVLDYDWQPRAFQITFHAYQNEKEESGENVGYRF